MFERFTEKARRVIFFARYEASQYGSPFIESEHLLLGLMREDKLLFETLLPQVCANGRAIRTEIEDRIDTHDRYATSVEVPLSDESKRILKFVRKEADRLGHDRIGTDHLLLGILREEKSAAAQILTKYGAVAAELRRKIAEAPIDRTWHGPGVASYEESSHARSQAALGSAIDAFLKSWAVRDVKAIASLFMDHGQLWDINGGLWHSTVQIERGLTNNFRLIASSEIPPDVRDIKMVTGGAAVVTLVWDPRGEANQPNAAAVRIVLVLCEMDPQWRIVSAHLASVPPGASAAAQPA